jgi:hypothetical protein
MERRAASHTEEEEMNQRRRLLNAAKKGDQKAMAKLLELYQVRVYNHDMVNKLNRAAGTHKLQRKGAAGKQAKGVQVLKKSLSKQQRAPITPAHGKKPKASAAKKSPSQKRKR